MSNLVTKWMIPLFSVFLLLFAAFFALTQEVPPVADILFSGAENNEAGAEENGEYDGDLPGDYDFFREIPDWVKPARWFRSNAGGMAIEEMPSRLAALRYEYSLVIDYSDKYELPEYLLPYYDDRYFIESRRLYENGKEIRAQWIFRNENAMTRLIASFSEIVKDAEEEEAAEDAAAEDADESPSEKAEIAEAVEKYEENAEQKEYKEHYANIEIDAVEIAAAEIAAIEYEDFDKIGKNGFIEIFNEEGYITTEYSFQEHGEVSKIIYNYNGIFVISAVTFFWEEDEAGGRFVEMFKDFYRYNRSSFLRAIERIFSRDQKAALSEPARVAFPGNILNAARNDSFMSEKLNAYPEFFGDLLVQKESKLVFTTDERGRILTQTLYSDSGEGEERKVIWTIVNTWQGERIVSIKKTEGETVLVSEYEYDAKDDRVLERNLKNGVIERVVRTEGKTDIEELYFNNVIVLRAVWEDGRKISETRVRNN